MHKVLILSLAALPIVPGAVITQVVNCGSPITVVSQPFPPTSGIQCTTADGQYAAVSGASGSMFNPGVVAASTAGGVAGMTAPPGPVSASLSLHGTFAWAPPPPAFVGYYWSPCTTLLPASGTGSYTFSLTLGPYQYGDPCDLAHAIPIPAGQPIVWSMDYLMTGSGNIVVAANISFGLLDPQGNPTPYGIGGSLQVLPDIPEPATMLPVAFVLVGCVTLAKTRRG